jgi:hypothetical protein
VGSSGSSAERCNVVTANGRILPALMCPTELAEVAKMSWMFPPSRSIIAGPPPL